MIHHSVILTVNKYYSSILNKIITCKVISPEIFNWLIFQVIIQGPIMDQTRNKRR